MIIRASRKSRFTVINNELIEDANLDWKDLGMLVYLLSKPDKWEISTAHLMNERKTNRDGVYAILKKLCDAGYATKKPKPEGGWSWVIYDEKQTRKQEKPNTDNPHTEKPNTEIPLTDNPTLVNTEYKTNTEKEINTDCVNAFNEFYSAYPKKVGKEPALKSWKKIKPALYEMIIADVKNRSANHIGWQDKQYVPNPATYLNQKRWEDEVNPIRRQQTNNVHPITQPKRHFMEGAHFAKII
jgi:hypothetical protein